MPSFDVKKNVAKVFNATGFNETLSLQ